MFKSVDYLYRHECFPMFGNGKSFMQPMFAHNLADAYFERLSNREITVHRDYNLSGKEPLSYADRLRTVCRALGNSTVMVRVPM